MPETAQLEFRAGKYLLLQDVSDAYHSRLMANFFASFKTHLASALPLQELSMTNCGGYMTVGKIIRKWKKVKSRSTIAAVLMVLFVPSIAFAQVQNERRGWGYGYAAFGGVAPNGSTVTLSLGGGGERLIYKDLGAGAELASITPLGRFDEGFGLFSTNASYHFGGRDSTRKTIPFVSGGYSLLFRDGTKSGLNVGGGIQYWPTRRVALRFEFRDHVFSDYGSYHLYGVRVGVMFR